MPEKHYTALHRLHFPIYTDVEGNLYTKEMEEDGVPKRAVYRYVENHEVNHKRRMLKMWDKFHDIRAIDSYMRIVGGITLSGQPLENIDAPVSDLQPDLATLPVQEDIHLTETQIKENRP